MNQFVPNKELAYIAKHGLSLTFYCRCGDSIGDYNCPRCGRKNEDKKAKKKEKTDRLSSFKIKW